MTTRGAARAVAAALAAATVAACGSGSPTASRDAPPTRDRGAAVPPPLLAEVRQYRSDVAQRVLQLTVTNPGDRPVTVLAARLGAPGFAELPATAKDSEVAPGRRLDLRVPYGPARCSSSPPPAAATAEVEVRGSAGSAVHRLGLEDPTGLLERLRSRECAERAVQEVVTLSLGPPWTGAASPEGGPAARGLVRLRRHQSGPRVTLEAVANSVVFSIAPVPPGGGAPLLALPAGATEASLPVEIRAARCDPHALTESKKSYDFPAWLALDGGEPVPTTLTADQEGRRLLDDLVRAGCAPGR